MKRSLRPWHLSFLMRYRFWNSSAIPHFLISRKLHENFDKLASLSSDLPKGEKGGKKHESRMINWMKHYTIKSNMKSCLKHVSTGRIHIFCLWCFRLLQSIKRYAEVCSSVLGVSQCLVPFSVNINISYKEASVL